MVIKYQKKIHEAFAKEVANNPAEEMARALEQFPNLKGKVTEDDFMDADARAIATGNIAICEHFAIKSDDAEAIEFTSPHLKTVKQTVKTNIAYYKSLLQFIRDEEETSYSKFYTAIQKKLDDYFAQAAEDILADVYGERYTTFFEVKSAECARDAKKNAPKKKKEEEENSEPAAE